MRFFSPILIRFIRHGFQFYICNGNCSLMMEKDDCCCGQADRPCPNLVILGFFLLMPLYAVCEFFFFFFNFFIESVLCVQCAPVWKY